MKNKTTAALLAFFLGGFGVHRFYLGESGKGILYLIFCWTLIPAIIALMDFIVFLTMDEQSFNKKYNDGINLGQNVNTSDELERLYALKEKGVISDQEFQMRKGKLL